MSAYRPVRVAITYLGREVATGESRSVESWRRLIEACGGTFHEVALLRDCPSSPASHWRDIPALINAAMVPEALAWSPPAAAARLREIQPDLLIMMTGRAYHPALVASAPTVLLDYRDSLALSYQGRAELASGWVRRAGYRLLAAAHRRFEQRPRPPGVRGSACGRSDAETLGVEWVPTLSWDFTRVDNSRADRDVLFVGNLGYPPNVAALNKLGRVWSRLLQSRPWATALVAGRRPSAQVRELAIRHGWELLADFGDPRDVYARARLTVAPMEQVAGMSTKVLDGAAMGLPQVVTPNALEGVDIDFPVTTAFGDAEFAAEIDRMLDDASRRDREAEAGWRHARARYSVDAWVPWGERLLAEAGQRRLLH